MSLTVEQLQWFCADADDEREFLRKPFRRGDFVYATNGHLCVRVPADGLMVDDLPAGKLTNIAELLSRPAPGPLVPFSVPLADKCKFCNGKRTIRLGSCDDCDGAGEFDHGQHTYECKRCDGAGWTDDAVEKMEGRPCGACRGLGRESHIDAIGRACFQRVYLNWIARLPGPVLLATGGPEESAAFTFDGGNGALMPMRA